MSTVAHMTGFFVYIVYHTIPASKDLYDSETMYLRR